MGESASTLSFRHGEIHVEHRLYHWLLERIAYDEDANAAFDGPFRNELDTDDDKSWSELREEFPAWFARWRSQRDGERPCDECDDGDDSCAGCRGTGVVPGPDTLFVASGVYGDGPPITVNSYNEETLLDQVILFTYFELRSGSGPGGCIASYVVLQIHGGCDVRGGYPNSFVVPIEVGLQRALGRTVGLGVYGGGAPGQTVLNGRDESVAQWRVGAALQLRLGSKPGVGMWTSLAAGYTVLEFSNAPRGADAALSAGYDFRLSDRTTVGPFVSARGASSRDRCTRRRCPACLCSGVRRSRPKGRRRCSHPGWSAREWRSPGSES